MSPATSPATRLATFNGGPLNGARLDIGERGYPVVTEGGRYELVDGEYYWHVSDAPDSSPVAESTSGAPAAPKPRTRARKRSAPTAD